MCSDYVGDTERLERRHSDCRKALKSLRDVLDEPFSIIVRDAAIQRMVSIVLKLESDIGS